ncbi:MAG: hypothetical protein KDM64_03825, partial [Verrucomicrobiae bacterium]|nr:hypothetical protein [Verrucomicrobiae bacterium]
PAAWRERASIGKALEMRAERRGMGDEKNGNGPLESGKPAAMADVRERAAAPMRQGTIGDQTLFDRKSPPWIRLARTAAGELTESRRQATFRHDPDGKSSR